MKQFSILFITCIMALLAVSCNDKAKSKFLSEKITADNIVDISTKLKTDKDMSLEDINLYVAGLNRLSGVKDTLVGKTVGEVIQSQRDALLKGSRLQLENASLQCEVKFTHTFQFTGLHFNDNDEGKANILAFTITNTADKDITNLQGYINIVNSSNQVVKKFPVNITKAIKKESTEKLTSAPYKHNDTNTLDVMVRTSKDLRPLWQPIYIQFEDGKFLDLNKSTKGIAKKK